MVTMALLSSNTKRDLWAHHPKYGYDELGSRRDRNKSNFAKVTSYLDKIFPWHVVSYSINLSNLKFWRDDLFNGLN